MKNYQRKMIFFAIDAILINIAVFGSLIFRFDGPVPSTFVSSFFVLAVITTIVKIAFYERFGLYKVMWEYAGSNEYKMVVIATMFGSIAEFITRHTFGFKLPRTVYVLSWILTLVMVAAIRIAIKLRHDISISKNQSASSTNRKKKVLIVGAGEASSLLIKEIKLKHNEIYDIVAAVDDDNKKRGLIINGVHVQGGRNDISRIVKNSRIDEIIIAIPSAKKNDISNIVSICKSTRCKTIKRMPSIGELINGDITIDKVKDVSIEDLLGRDEIVLNTAEIAGYITGKRILITGAGGSIGSELCRQIAKFSPEIIIMLDNYENGLYDIQNELKKSYGTNLDMVAVIATVRDYSRLNEIFEEFLPNVVFHAAAHKHVPLMEGNPSEAVKNNIVGTKNMCECSSKYGVNRFVLISTDKAVNPTNVMGATKRVAELIVQSYDKVSQTEFVAVRFGNVLGSNGSVIPLFKKQIAEGGPVTVTHPDVIRYFMTIPEAVRLVIQAGAMADGGEIFILDMGKPIKILDLATDLIRLSGYDPDHEIKVEFTGLRPGEKLYEELLLSEEGIGRTKHELIHVARPLNVDGNEFWYNLESLINVSDVGSEHLIRKELSKIVGTYKYMS